MGDLLKTAAAWLNRQRHEQLATSVTYRRGGSGSPTTLSATSCRVSADVAVEAEMEVNGQLQDWIFRAEDFVVSGDFVPPARLDTITDADGNEWQLCELGSEPCWRYSTPHNVSVRVHTVKV
jgi:hypothetical protein